MLKSDTSFLLNVLTRPTPSSKNNSAVIQMKIYSKLKRLKMKNEEMRNKIILKPLSLTEFILGGSVNLTRVNH